MSEADNTRHAFDRAISLTPSAPNRFTGHTTDAYSNMVGPFGGITAAALLNAVLQHPERIGEPVALTVNFAGPIAAGEFVIEALPVRTNRSTQHWTLQLRQNDMVATTATVFCAMRRETWSEQELPAPEAPAPETLPPLPDIGLHGWTANYDFRFVSGMFNPSRPASEAPASSRSLLWIRDQPQRPLDFPALAALGDSFFPRVFTRRQRFVPAGTVSMTLYFHTDSAQLAEIGSDYLLAEAVANQTRNNYFDQSAHLWSRDGQLLLSSTQIVYFKE